MSAVVPVGRVSSSTKGLPSGSSFRGWAPRISSSGVGPLCCAVRDGGVRVLSGGLVSSSGARAFDIESLIPGWQWSETPLPPTSRPEPRR